jgi:hypothetical protein
VKKARKNKKGVEIRNDCLNKKELKKTNEARQDGKDGREEC